MLNGIDLYVDNTDRFLTEDFLNVARTVNMVNGITPVTVELGFYFEGSTISAVAECEKYTVKNIVFSGGSLLLECGVDFVDGLTVPTKNYTVLDFSGIFVG